MHLAVLNHYGCSTYSVSFLFKPIKHYKFLFKEIFLLYENLHVYQNDQKCFEISVKMPNYWHLAKHVLTIELY